MYHPEMERFVYDCLQWPGFTGLLLRLRLFLVGFSTHLTRGELVGDSGLLGLDSGPDSHLMDQSELCGPAQLQLENFHLPGRCEDVK